MRYALLAIVLVGLTVSGAYAQRAELLTARSLGMGTASIAVANDGAAWWQNPAGLGALGVPVLEDNIWGVDAIGSFARWDHEYEYDLGAAQDFFTDDSSDVWSLTVSGWQPDKAYGLGAGIGDVEDMGTAVGAGFGMAVRDTPLAVGLNVVHSNPDDDDEDSVTQVNIGALYAFEQPERAPIKVGLLVGDIFDDADQGVTLNAGIAWPATQGLLLAADIQDITDQSDDGPYFNIGAEYRPVSMPNLALRAGAMDGVDGHDLTLGAGYAWDRWRIDAAYADFDDGVWQISIGAGF